MGIVNLVNLVCATFERPETGHFVADLIKMLADFLGDVGYGVVVVVFTLLLKLIMSPLDIWQKAVTAKNNTIMKRMKPEMEKLQKAYGHDKQTFSVKQMELYKKHGYKMAGACLPMIITLVVFFIVFAGFNAMTRYQIINNFIDITEEFEAYEEEARASGLTNDADIVAYAQDKVAEDYKPDGFLWIKNVFVADTFWDNPIPSYDKFIKSIAGTETSLSSITQDNYNMYMAKIIEKYPSTNGFLILPVLTIAVSFLAQFLMKSTTPQPAPGADAAGANSSMQIMQYLMPLMMGIFALFYSATFTIYMVISQFVSMAMQLIFNLVYSVKEKRAEEKRLSTTFKR